jgi:hypothetical protein
MKKLSKFILILSSLALLPSLVFAQTRLEGFLSSVQGILDTILPILISLAVIYFIWGVVQYIIGDGEEAKKTGKERIIYGLIGFAVILSMWGLVDILVGTFGLKVSAPGLSTVVPQSSACRLGKDLGGFFNFITCLINSAVIPLIFALATLMFIWGVVQFFIIGANEEAKREQGKQFIIWGVIALTVMISIWGLVNILTSTFGVNSSILPEVCPEGGCSK